MASGIVLRPPVLADASAILEAVRESMSELSPWMSWCTPGYALEDAATWVRSSARGREAGEAFEFVIEADEGRLLGCCGLTRVDLVNRFANLGYWVRRSETGRGVATTSARLLASWAFQHTDLERLEIVPDVENLRSQRVAAAVGSRCEGVLSSRLCTHGTFHDAVMHSIVKSSWVSA